ncbi:hypothetical protein NEOKW01_1556 [Nematocida sp. AWRm80]|nr:hypothetical protein NEOKW01_1556 [Nematocida sp. AWRm80]
MNESRIEQLTELMDLINTPWITPSPIQERQKEIARTQLAHELKYCSRNEAQMSLRIIREIDTSRNKEETKKIIQCLIDLYPELFPQVFQVLKANIEEIHLSCIACHGDTSCITLLSRIITKLTPKEAFHRETKKYIYLQNTVSVSIVSKLLKEASVKSEHFISLFFLYNTLYIPESIEAIGLLFTTLSQETIIVLMNKTYKKHDYFYILRCGAYIACAVANEGITEKTAGLVEYLLSRDIESALKKCPKSKPFHLLLYTLSLSLVYLYKNIPHRICDDLLPMLYNLPMHQVLFRALRIIGEITRDQTRLSIFSCGIDLILKGRKVSLEEIQLLERVSQLNSFPEVPPPKVQQLIRLLLQHNEYIDQTLMVLKEIKRVYRAEREIAISILRQSIDNRNTIDPVYFSLIEPDTLSEELKKQLVSVVEVSLRTLPPREAYTLLKSILNKIPEKHLDTLGNLLSKRSLENRFFAQLTVETITRMKVPLIPEKSLINLRHYLKESLQIARITTNPQRAKEIINESLWQINSSITFDQGTRTLFAAIQETPPLIQEHYHTIEQRLLNSIQNREVNKYYTAFKVLYHIYKNSLKNKDQNTNVSIVSKHTILNRYIDTLIDKETILWLYHHKTMQYSLLSLIPLAREIALEENIDSRESKDTKTIKCFKQLVPVLQYISQESTLRTLSLECRYLLQLIPKDTYSESMLLVDNKVVYCIGRALEMDLTEESLVALSNGISQMSNLSLKDKHAFSLYALESIKRIPISSSGKNEILYMVLRIDRTMYKEVLQSIDISSLNVSSESILLASEIILSQAQVHEVSPLVQRIDQEYLEQRRIQKPEHKMYLALKILQNRKYKEFTRHTTEIILNKIETDGISSAHSSLVQELFTYTFISPEEVLSEIERRTNQDIRNTNTFQMVHKLITSSEKSILGRVEEIYIDSGAQTVLFTEALSIFREEPPVSIQVDRHIRLRDQCQSIWLSTGKHMNLKGIMLFFVKESVYLVIRALKDLCDSRPEILNRVFPLAVYLSLEDLGNSNRKYVIETLSHLVSQEDISHHSKEPFVQALEYISINDQTRTDSLPVLKQIHSSVKSRYIIPMTSEKELEHLYTLIAYSTIEKSEVFLKYLKHRLEIPTETFQGITEAYSLYFTGRYDQSQKLLSDLSYPGILVQSTFSLLDTLQQIGTQVTLSTVQIENELLQHLDSILLDSHEQMQQWSTPVTEGIYQVYLLLDNNKLSPLSKISKSLQVLEESTLQGGTYLITPGYLRVHQTFKGLLNTLLETDQSKSPRIYSRERALSIDRLSSQEISILSTESNNQNNTAYLEGYPKSINHKDISTLEDTLVIDHLRREIRNELIAQSLRYESISNASTRSFISPLAGALEVFLRAKKVPLIRSILALTSSDESLLKYALEHYATVSASRKEYEENSKGLLHKDQERHCYSHLINRVANRYLRHWDMQVFHQSTPLKKKLEGLKTMIRSRPQKADILLFLSLFLQVDSPEHFSHCKQIFDDLPIDWFIPYIYEVLTLSPRLSKCQVYQEMVNRLYEYSSERFISIWVLVMHSIQISIPGIENTRYYSVYKTFSEIVREIAETSNEAIQKETKRLKEAMQRIKPTIRTETRYSSSGMFTGASPGFTEKNISRLCQLLIQRQGQAQFREVPSEEKEADKAISVFIDLVMHKNTHKAWKILCINQVEKISGILTTILPKRLILNTPATEALKGILLPGTTTRVYSAVKDIPVMHSLQRPRKISFLGEDGQIHSYMIKKESSIEIERTVSHFFSLFPVKYAITHSIFPGSISLSTYIPGTLSLKEAVVEVRSQKEIDLGAPPKTLVSKEKHMLAQLCYNYNLLREIEKLEIYHKITNFSGTELKDWLVNYSLTSEEYFARTKTFCNSYLYSSLVGYLIGLGDRHPGNILLHHSSAEAIHIDYIDALDVLQTRRMHQEKVPLRLTPMILSVLGPTAEEQFVSAVIKIFSVYSRSYHYIEAILSLFFINRAHHRQLSLQTSLERVSRKVPQSMHIEEEGCRLYRDSTSSELLSQMYLGWMPFW